MTTVTDQEWVEYKEKFKKTYNDEEDVMRRELFVKTKTKIAEHQKKFDAGEVTWEMGINHMSDFTEQEFHNLCGSRKPPQ